MLSTETPIISADSCRVDTEERRRWCELRFGLPTGGNDEGETGGLPREGSIEDIEEDMDRDGVERDALRECERE